MDLIVQKYLSRYYYIKTSDVGNDGIYEKLDDRKRPSPFSSTKLLKEISVIFSLSEEEVKAYVTNWSVLIKTDVDLEFYWKTMDMIMPMSVRIAAQTIGLDLVTVQPMATPVGELMFLDFQHGDVPDRNGRVYDREVMDDAIMELYENQQQMLGELDHPQVDIEITDRNDSSVYSFLQKWSSLIGVSSRGLKD